MDAEMMRSLRERAWRKSSVEFTNYLDVGQIYAPLNSRNCLTVPQGAKLRNDVIGSATKINDLMAWMPAKGGKWFEDFVGALNETKTGTGHATIIEALQKNLYEAAKELEISQEVVDSEVSAIFGSTDSVIREVNPIQEQQVLQLPQQSQSQDNDPMSKEPFVNHENWTLGNLKDEYKEKKKKIQQLPITVATKEQLNGKVTDLKNYSILIEVVNDIEFMTAICQMDEEIYQCTVRDDLTNSDSTYFYGKWGKVLVVIVQTGTKFGSQFQYGSWFETKKALYYMPELKHVFGVGVCGAVVDPNSEKHRVPLGHVVISSHIFGYDHQKKKAEGDENRDFSSNMSGQSFYQYLCRLINKDDWDEGLRFGRVLSGSWLVADIKAQKLVLDSSRSDEIAFEMEGVGIAAACQNNTITNVEDWLVIKGVSDYANRHKDDEWQPAAARNATRYLSDMINKKHTTSYVRQYILRVIFILLLLSYTSLASTSLQLLRATRYPGYDGLYVCVSPDMKYFNDRHAFYGAVALLCGAIAVIGLPLFLLLEPLILSRWFNFVRIMPLLDQFQSCYKDNYRWFAAYYLICRQVIIIIVYFGNNDYYEMLYYLQTACVVIAMLHISFQPYKSSFLNAFDEVVLLIIILMVNANTLTLPFSFYLQTAFVVILMVYNLIYDPPRAENSFIALYILCILCTLVGAYASLPHDANIYNITSVIIIPLISLFVIIIVVIILQQEGLFRHSTYRVESDVDGDKDSKCTDYKRLYGYDVIHGDRDSKTDKRLFLAPYEYEYTGLSYAPIPHAVQASQRKVFNNENCPLRDCLIISKMFGNVGGELLIKEHAIKVTVPVGAIDENYEIQIQAAASLFGPFIITEGYYPISAYVWIGACYKFKKKLKIEMEHDIVVSEETNISELCVLTACEEDKCDGENNQILYKMHEDTCEYHYELNKSTCTIFTSHLCSKCLAAKEKEAKKARRIVMYHYLPEDYKSEHEFVAEVCLCYDLQFCKERTEKRYAERRMEQESSTFVRIFNWEEDKFLLIYPQKVENWEICHSGYDEIIAEALNFRLWYENVDDLLRDEENDRFPPRFKLKIVQKDYNLSTLGLLYKYEICVQSKRSVHLTLSISGFGQQFLEKASIHQQQPLVVDVHQNHSALTSSSLQQCHTAINSEHQSQALLPLSQPLTAPVSQQQLQPVFQVGDKTTNATYIFGNTISLATSDGPSTNKPTFNSLWSFANDITNTVNVDVILPMMIQRGLVSADHQQYLSNPYHTTGKKQQKLCGIILELPESCVDQFINCLSETSDYQPHKQLHDKLYAFRHTTA